MTAAPAQQKEQNRKFSSEAIITFVLALVVWVFSAGILWQKVDDLEKKVDLIERVLLKPNPAIAANQ